MTTIQSKCVHWIGIDSISASVPIATHTERNRNAYGTKGRSKRAISLERLRFCEPFGQPHQRVFLSSFTIFGNPAHKQLIHSKWRWNENGKGKKMKICGMHIIECYRIYHKNEEIKGAEGYAYEKSGEKKEVKRHDFITIFVAVFHYSTHIATVLFFCPPAIHLSLFGSLTARRICSFLFILGSRSLILSHTLIKKKIVRYVYFISARAHTHTPNTRRRRPGNE